MLVGSAIAATLAATAALLCVNAAGAAVTSTGVPASTATHDSARSDRRERNEVRVRRVEHDMLDEDVEGEEERRGEDGGGEGVQHRTRQCTTPSSRDRR
jgi:hypothetical protein